MRDLLEFIYSELKSNRAVVSAVIVSSSGSTPRSTGSRMAIAADGRCAGSVGGGPGEAMVQREAKKIHNIKQSIVLRLDLSGQDVAKEGMICGGRQELLLEYLEPNKEEQGLFSKLLSNWDQGLNSLLCTTFQEREHGAEILSKVQDPNALPAGLPEYLYQEVAKRTHKSRRPFAVQKEGYTVLIEPIQHSGTVYVLGAGHVGLAAANLSAYVGFITYVLDDRSDFLINERFANTCHLHQVASFNTCFEGLQPGPDSLIVILTRGHLHDKTVLGEALQTSAQYIGMIGSQKKREAIYKDLLEEGFSQADLDRVQCPIGLSIGAETPQELGVSIVAELIQERASS